MQKTGVLKYFTMHWLVFPVILFLQVNLGLADGLYLIPIHAIRLANDNGTDAANITPAQVGQWVDRANDIFAEADIQFVFDSDPNGPDWETRNSTLLNTMTGDKHPDWGGSNGQLKTANAIAAQHPGKIVVFFRELPGGFSWWTYNFIVMPGFNSGVCGHQNLELFAHEMGHFLGLAHTFTYDFACKKDADAYFKTITTICKLFNKAGKVGCVNLFKYVFDADGQITDPEHKVTDTDPDPFVRGDTCLPAIQCDPNVTSIDLPSVAGAVNFVLPRDNIMSYYDPHDDLTPQQINIVRKTLEKRFPGRLERRPDLAITAGSKLSEDYSPFGQFESPDIWVDSQKNGFNVYPPNQQLDTDGAPMGPGDPLWVNEKNRIWFRVRNLGDIGAEATQVKVFASQKVLFSGTCGSGASQGPEELIGERPVPFLEPLEEHRDFVEWKPTKTGPVSIRVEITPITGEASTFNNKAIETTYIANSVQVKADAPKALNTFKATVSNPCDLPIFIVAVPVEIPPVPDPRDPWKVKLSSREILKLQPGRQKTIEIGVKASLSALPGEMGEISVAMFQLTSSAPASMSEEITDEEAERIQFDELELIGVIKILSQVVERASISCRAPKRPVEVYTPVAITGAINPLHGESPLALKYISPSRQSYIHDISTDREGNYSDSFSPEETGRWTVQAFWQGDEDHQSAKSKRRSFRVVRTRR